MLKMHSEPKRQKLLDLVVNMSERFPGPGVKQLTYACVIEVKRHTHELEIIQCDGRHTFLNASEYLSYRYTDQ